MSPASVTDSLAKINSNQCQRSMVSYNTGLKYMSRYNVSTILMNMDMSVYKAEAKSAFPGGVVDETIWVTTISIHDQTT